MKRQLIGTAFCLSALLVAGTAQADYAQQAVPNANAENQLSYLDGQLFSDFTGEENAPEIIDGQNVFSPFMQVYNKSLPPIGYVRFCERHPEECVSTHSVDDRVEFTQERWQELESINRFVNQEVYPITDEELYGRVEFWTYPNGKGDCEDYVLMKRQLLIERGWPKSALLITVVLDEEGAGHAILTARTSGGDFILDNKIQDVTSWADTPYRFLKRQSAQNPQEWVSLYPANDNGPVAAFSSEALAKH